MWISTTYPGEGVGEGKVASPGFDIFFDFQACGRWGHPYIGVNDKGHVTVNLKGYSSPRPEPELEDLDSESSSVSHLSRIYSLDTLLLTKLGLPSRHDAVALGCSSGLIFFFLLFFVIYSLESWATLMASRPSDWKRNETKMLCLRTRMSDTQWTWLTSLSLPKNLERLSPW